MAVYERVAKSGKVIRFHYSEEDSALVVGSPWAWNINGQGYVQRSYRRDGKFVNEQLHKLIVKTLEGNQVDHINRNRLDCRRENLREVTVSQNNFNKALTVKNKSGLKGVSWSNRANKWYASIKVDNKSINLGHYDCPIEAAKAYDIAAIKYRGPSAFTNRGGGLLHAFKL